MASGAINDLTSIPAPKKIELTGNEVKSKAPIAEVRSILRELQAITLLKFMERRKQVLLLLITLISNLEKMNLRQ